MTMFADLYRNRRVLLTGHTGFKGSYLAFWLKKLGAEVCGVALPMEKPNHFDLLPLDIRSEQCDIRDREKLGRIWADFRPEIVFHLAAQPLVRRSYREPLQTFETNVMGTANVLDCCRFFPGVRAVVAVTSDKCYENREWDRPYREDDPMGGFDPYSASKGAAELVIASYRRSFFNPGEYGKKHSCLIASARAGNVVGGGDWAADRLVPDLMRSAAAGKVEEIRSPDAVRPWQHVWEPLSGYLALGAKLLAGEPAFACGWNFGPEQEESRTVAEVAAMLARSWDRVKFRANPPEFAPHEAKLLRLDCTRAREKLNWHGVWSVEETMRRTAEWYRLYYMENSCRTEEDWRQYCEDAGKKDLAWTK